MCHRHREEEDWTEIRTTYFTAIIEKVQTIGMLLHGAPLERVLDNISHG